MTNEITVALIEDHALTRAGLRTVLQAHGITICFEAADGVSGLAGIEQHQPSVAIIDLGLPGYDGLELTRRIRAAKLPVGIVILTMADIDRDVRSAIAAGADAYCVKASESQVIVDAVRTVAAGGAYFDPQIARMALRGIGGDAHRANAAAEEELSEREIEVLRHIAEGRSNPEIAQLMHLSVGTIKGHIAEILAKLSASDRAQAAVIGYRRGLLGE